MLWRTAPTLGPSLKTKTWRSGRWRTLTAASQKNDLSLATVKLTLPNSLRFDTLHSAKTVAPGLKISSAVEEIGIRKMREFASSFTKEQLTILSVQQLKPCFATNAAHMFLKKAFSEPKCQQWCACCPYIHMGNPEHTHSWRRPLADQNVDDGVLMPIRMYTFIKQCDTEKHSTGCSTHAPEEGP